MSEDDSDYQTASYERLCGCVSVLIPPTMAWAYQSAGEERPNLEMTRRLIEHGKGTRMVDAGCWRCRGTGLLPPVPDSGTPLALKRIVLTCDPPRYDP